MTAKRFLMFYDAPSAVKFVENQIKGEVDIIKDFTKRNVKREVTEVSLMNVSTRPQTPHSPHL